MRFAPQKKEESEKEKEKSATLSLKLNVLMYLLHAMADQASKLGRKNVFFFVKTFF